MSVRELKTFFERTSKASTSTNKTQPPLPKPVSSSSSQHDLGTLKIQNEQDHRNFSPQKQRIFPKGKPSNGGESNSKKETTPLRHKINTQTSDRISKPEQLVRRIEHESPRKFKNSDGVKAKTPPIPPPKPNNLVSTLTKNDTLSKKKVSDIRGPSEFPSRQRKLGNGTSEVSDVTALPKSNVKDTRMPTLQEWLSTEISYVKDLRLILEYFVDPAKNLSETIFSKFEQVTLFSNIRTVYDLASILLEQWDTVNREERRALDMCPKFAEIFLRKEVHLTETYAIYCRGHDAAMNCLTTLSQERPAFAEWLKLQEAKMKSKTTSWNLASLLIKPVQRILKYPLLIQELLNRTTEVEGRKQLEHALLVAQKIAESINEIKKRRDLVESIVDPHEDRTFAVLKRFDVGRKLTRKIQQMRLATGLSVNTYDEVFEEFEARLMLAGQAIEELIKIVEEESKLQKDYIIEWKRSLDMFVGCLQFEKKETGVARLGELFGAFMEPAQEALEKGYLQVISEFRRILKIFEDPWIVIRKRNELLLDHDRCRDMREKGIRPDVKLVEGEQAYLSINAQLIEDLPMFLDHVAAFVGVCIEEWFTHLISYYERISIVCVESAMNSLVSETILQFRQYHMRHTKHLLENLVSLKEATRLQVTHALMDTGLTGLTHKPQLSFSASDSFDSYPFSSSLDISNSSSQPLLQARALYDYTSRYSWDLSLRAQDRLLILDGFQPLDLPPKSSEWHYVELLRTHQRGFVPVSYVQKDL